MRSKFLVYCCLMSRTKSIIAILTLVVLSLYYIKSSESILDDDWTDEYYPTNIPVYNVRKDYYTKNEVSRGRFHAFKRNPKELLHNETLKVTLKQFKTTLQCARSEPTINGQRGIIDMLKMIPPTRAIVERVCAYADSKCPWSQCGNIVDKYRHANGTICRPQRQERNLIRVINGSLYRDWPWCIEQDGINSEPYESMTMLMMRVLDFVKDIPDSVFLVGEEISSLPWNLPFPILTNSPSFISSDIPLPWVESLRTEWMLYANAEDKNDFSFESYRKPFVPKSLPWNERIEKAAYFGEMISIRQIFFTQALLRPDLIEARWKCDNCGINPWNPLSTEQFSYYFSGNGDANHQKIYHEGDKMTYKMNKSEVGYLEPLKHIQITQPANLKVGHYKYLVVLTGIDALAASGRLASFLAYSGAVILLQLSQFEYHFSARLKPWVHYVPLTYSAADIVSKVEWLKAHDKEAQQIAENARNFGLSYLRLEDQYCYVATLLETLAEIVNGTDATTAWDPRKLTKIANN